MCAPLSMNVFPTSKCFVNVLRRDVTKLLQYLCSHILRRDEAVFVLLYFFRRRSGRCVVMIFFNFPNCSRGQQDAVHRHLLLFAA